MPRSLAKRNLVSTSCKITAPSLCIKVINTPSVTKTIYFWKVTGETMF